MSTLTKVTIAAMIVAVSFATVSRSKTPTEQEDIAQMIELREQFNGYSDERFTTKIKKIIDRHPEWNDPTNAQYQADDKRLDELRAERLNLMIERGYLKSENGVITTIDQPDNRAIDRDVYLRLEAIMKEVHQIQDRHPKWQCVMRTGIPITNPESQK